MPLTGSSSSSASASPKPATKASNEAAVANIKEKAKEAEAAVNALKKATHEFPQAEGVVEATIAERASAAQADANDIVASAQSGNSTSGFVQKKHVDEAVDLAITAAQAAATAAKQAANAAVAAVKSIEAVTKSPTAAIAVTSSVAVNILNKMIKDNITDVVVSGASTDEGAVIAGGGSDSSTEELQIKISIDDPTRVNETVEQVAGKIVKVLELAHGGSNQEQMELNLVAVALVLVGISLFFHVITKVAKKRQWRERTYFIYGLVRLELTRYMGELAALVFFIFATSISISELNKYVVSYWQGSFKAPLGITACHIFLKACYAYGVLWAKRGWDSKSLLRPIDSHFYFTYILPMGVATGLDLALFNVSIMLMTLSSITVIKTSGIMWTMVLSIMCGILEPTHRILISVGIIVIGLVLANLGEGLIGEVNVWGFLLVIISVLLGSIKSVLVQIILQGWSVPEIENGDADIIKGNLRSRKLTP